jgi:hypothetical protein
MKKTETYKMSRQVKTSMSLMPGMINAEKRNYYKNMMIRAELHASSVEKVVLGKAVKGEE